jgi:hypothetical protein
MRVFITNPRHGAALCRGVVLLVLAHVVLIPVVLARGLATGLPGCGARSYLQRSDVRAPHTDLAGVVPGEKTPAPQGAL